MNPFPHAYLSAIELSASTSPRLAHGVYTFPCRACASLRKHWVMPVTCGRRPSFKGWRSARGYLDLSPKDGEDSCGGRVNLCEPVITDANRSPKCHPLASCEPSTLYAHNKRALMKCVTENYLTRLRPHLRGCVPLTDPSPLAGRAFELVHRDETCERGYRWLARFEGDGEELVCFQLRMTRADYESVFGPEEARP